MLKPQTPGGFDRLLEALDADREQAGQRYEDLRRTLIRFFEWRGVAFAEDHADETFDRVVKKLAARVEIANIGGYCYEVARLVCLEALKSPAKKLLSLDDVRVPAPAARDLGTDAEMRQDCLDDCLSHLPRESRELILEYYRDDRRARIERRRALAERFGLRRDSLANRAQRIRDKLETCVSRCLARKIGDMNGHPPSLVGKE